MTDILPLKEILTEYGPLGFGWIVALMLWKHNMSLQKLLIGLTEKNTSIMTKIAVVIEERLPRRLS